MGTLDISSEVEVLRSLLNGINNNLDGEIRLLAGGQNEIIRRLDLIMAKLSTTVPPATVARVRAVLVSYFGDTTMWQKYRSLRPPFGIINCDSGNAVTIDLRYAKEVPLNKAAGIPTLGYTHTKGANGYGTRPLAEVFAAVDRYTGFYATEGNFIDCCSPSSDPAMLAVYEQLATGLRQRGLKFCFNTGTAGPERHAQLADWVLISENYWDKTLLRTAQPWELKTEYRGKLWWVAHGCPPAEMQRVFDHMVAQGAGLVTITDDVYPNPYDKLPTNIDALFAAAKAVV